MKESKYIIGDIADNYGVNKNVAVVFPDIVPHDVVGRQLFIQSSIQSAGFCYINNEGRVTVYGHSVSLNMAVRKGVDEEIIETALAIKKDF